MEEERVPETSHSVDEVHGAPDAGGRAVAGLWGLFLHP